MSSRSIGVSEKEKQKQKAPPSGSASRSSSSSSSSGSTTSFNTGVGDVASHVRPTSHRGTAVRSSYGDADAALRELSEQLVREERTELEVFQRRDCSEFLAEEQSPGASTTIHAASVSATRSADELRELVGAPEKLSGPHVSRPPPTSSLAAAFASSSSSSSASSDTASATSSSASSALPSSALPSLSSCIPSAGRIRVGPPPSPSSPSPTAAIRVDGLLIPSPLSGRSVDGFNYLDEHNAGSYGSFGSFDGLLSPGSSSRFYVGARGVGRPNRFGQPPSIMASSPANRAQGMDVLMIPSQSVDPRELAKIQGVVYYEERSLFPSILLLRNPSTRLAFLSSLPVSSEVIDYYLELIATPRQQSSFRKRILMLSCDDPSCDPLSAKLLKRPDLIKTLKDWIRPGQANMRCIVSTQLEVDLATELGVPLLANDPQFSHLGTKHGSRFIFEKAGVPLPDGIPEVFNEKDLILGLNELWKRNPKQNKVVIKLNEGISGEGNVVLKLYKLHELVDADDETRIKALEQAVREIEYHEKDDYSSFMMKLESMGAIAECWLEGEDLTSPSGQATILPNGDVELLSTHEQLLDGQEYQGCLFPAEDKYRDLVHKYTLQIGKALALEGGRERFSVDFIAVRKPTADLHVEDGEDDQDDKEVVLEDEHDWLLYAIEINLRSGGTTHPYEATRLLVSGTYGQLSGSLQASEDRPKCYRATDNLCSEHFKSLSITELRKMIRGTSAEWDHDKEKGCVFHFVGAMKEYGKLGVIAVGDSPDEVDEIFEDAVQTLVSEAKRMKEKKHLS
mmetsp:Transcript_12987/g.39260  ORF Transcript_12987/g.39260 Transcript_12987/m.39260 type:complete len:794 (+) Transcript_12987:126-2507(+)